MRLHGTRLVHAFGFAGGGCSFGDFGAHGDSLMAFYGATRRLAYV
jgi:hypothetical protein